MVYGLLGLTTAWARGKFNIDYSATVAEVYTSVVEHEVNTSRRLDIITYAIPCITSANVTPSWVPNWSVHCRGYARLQNTQGPHFKYTAAGTTEVDAKILDDKQTLVIRGVNLGVIQYIEMPMMMENNEELKHYIAAFSS